LAVFIRRPQSQTPLLKRVARRLFIASFACLLTLILASKEIDAREGWMGTLGIALFSLLFAALIALCLQPGITQRIFSLPTLRWLGKISYGIYVYHVMLYPVFSWLTHRLFPDLTGRSYELMLAGVATVGTVSAAALSFAILESSFLRLKGSLGAVQPPPASAA
jgi:peptidoglycan/LPS O-acetylase OafA/YrhL